MRIGPEPTTITLRRSGGGGTSPVRVGAVEVRRLGRELAGTGVDPPVGRAQCPARTRARRTATGGTPPRAARCRRRRSRLAWHRSAARRPRRRSASTSSASRSVNHGAMPVAADDAGGIGPAVAQEADHPPQPRVGRRRGTRRCRPAAAASGPMPGPPRVHPRPRGSSERTALRSAGPNSRSIAIASPVAFICTPERAVGVRELVERPARQLDDDVVDRRLEGGGVPIAGRRVRQLVQPLAQADQGRQPRDRVAGRLGGQR